jgi:hypothetical protein
MSLSSRALKRSEESPSEDEISRRRDEALLRALSTPHKRQAETSQKLALDPMKLATIVSDLIRASAEAQRSARQGFQESPS